MCGLAGVISKKLEYSVKTSRITYYLGAGLNNRGRDACGTALVGKDHTIIRRRPGTVTEALPLTFIDSNPSVLGTIHTRYPTQGNSNSQDDNIEKQNYSVDTDDHFDIKNAQPFSTI